jgi:beta-lactam-binding protein with PASTA domain
MGISVPDLTGETLTQAQAALKNAGLALGTSAGTGNKIASTTPGPGLPEPFGAKVNLHFGTVR